MFVIASDIEQVRDFELHHISVTIDILGLVYGMKNYLFEHLLDIRDQPTRPVPPLRNIWRTIYQTVEEIRTRNFDTV